MAEETTITPAPTPQSNGTDWRNSLPPDMQQIPAVKEANDLPSFVKRFNDQSSELGRRTRIPDPNKADEFKAFQDSVRKAGLTVIKGNAPESPDAYEIKRPDNVPEMAWSEKTVGAFKQLAHKWGLPQEAIKELIDFDAQRFGELEPVLAIDRQKSEQEIQAMAEKEGIPYEDVANNAKTFMERIGVTEDQIKLLEAAGLANHPKLLWIMHEIGQHWQESNGLTGQPTQESRNAKAEADSIILDKNNPRYEAFHRGDAETHAYVQALYRKANPGTYTG